MKFRKKTAALTVFLLICAAGVIAWLHPFHGIPAEDPTAAAPAAVQQPSGDTVKYAANSPQLAMIRSQVLTSMPLPLGETLSARVAYDEDRTARIGVSISGRIVALKAAPGDTVRAGKVLAEIDSPDFGAAQADLGKARADEERKRLAVERARELGGGEGIALKDVEAANADYLAARAETVRAQQRVNNLSPGGVAAVGQRIALASPITGVVSERNATPALEVNPGLAAPLFVVTDPYHLWLMIDVPETLLAKLKPGSTVMVESDAYPDERFQAVIMKLAQVMDPNTRRLLARARLDNPKGKLLPEMLVRANVLSDVGHAVRVPNSAIVDRGIYPFVFVETATGEFQRRRIQLLTRGADASFVAAGLQNGERVVTTGALLLDAELGSSAAGKT